MTRGRVHTVLNLLLAAAAGCAPSGAYVGRAPRREARKETIDDVLARAKARKGKGAFDRRLDGRVQERGE